MKVKNTYKMRFLYFVLSLTLLIGLIPTTAYATENFAIGDIQITNADAAVIQSQFDAKGSSIAVVTNNYGTITIKLLKDITGRIEIHASGNYIFDANDHTFSGGSQNEAIGMGWYKNVTLELVGNGTYISGVNNTLVVNDNTLIIKSATVNGNLKNSGILKFALEDGCDYFTVKNNGNDVFDEKNSVTQTQALGITGTGTGLVVVQHLILSEAIDSITTDNVKSSDKTAIEIVKSNAENIDTTYATAAEKAVLKDITDKCNILLKKISDTDAEIKRIADAVNGYNLATVISSDIVSLEQLVKDIDTIVASGNVTADETAALGSAKTTVNGFLTKISDIAAEIFRITDAVNSYDLITVKSSDKASIDQIIIDIETLKTTENLTEDENAALGTVKTNANALLLKISDAAKALTKKEIKDAENINKDNVQLTDKKTLAKSKTALESAIMDYEGNYTETELTALKDQFKTVIAALAAIDNSEKVVIYIIALPEAAKVKINDKDAINAAKFAYDILSDAEKAMVGSDYVIKLNADLKALNDLGKSNSPETGETDNMFLWITLLFISGSALTILCVNTKHRNKSEK